MEKRKKDEEEEAIPKLTKRPRRMNSPKRMPMRGERRAPRFTGKPEELPRYFDDFELLADDVELDDEARVEWACRYVENYTDEETWKTARALYSRENGW